MSFLDHIKTIDIPEGSTGWSYKRIFAEYLKGCSCIIIRDPYIRTRLQVSNLTDFLMTVNREVTNKVEVHLVTRVDGPDERDCDFSEEEKLKQQADNLNVLVRAFKASGSLNVKFSWEVDKSPLDFRKLISFDNGWKIHSNRGFGIWDTMSDPSVKELPQGDRPTKKCIIRIYNPDTVPDSEPNGQITQVPPELISDPEPPVEVPQVVGVKVYSGKELPTFVHDELLRLQGVTNNSLTPAPNHKQPQPTTVPKQTIYVPKVIANPVGNTSTITIPGTIDNLSLEEIEKLLPQLQASMEASKRRPIQDVVDEVFNEEWPEIEGTMQREFEDNLNKDKRNFFLRTSLNSILSKSVGEDIAKDFFRTVNHCQETRNFKGTQTFFQKVKGPEFYEVREVAKVSFAVYRLNKRAILGDDYFGRPSSLKETIRDAAKSDSVTVKNVVSQFRQLNLID